MIESKRFLLVSGDFVRIGGMDLANYHLATHLATLGVPVHIVSHNVDPELSGRSNVVWHRAPRPRGSSICGEPMLNIVARRVARKVGGRAAGTRTVVNGGNCPLPDVNWVHYLHATVGPVGGGGRLRQAKARFAYRMFRRSEEVALRNARLILANSNRTKTDLLRCYNIDPSLVHTVYCGINPADFYPMTYEEKIAARAKLGFAGDKYLIAFVGALGDRRKGLDTLFKAWKEVALEKGFPGELLIIGTGTELSQWKRRAAAHSAGKSIRFLGLRRDVPAILRACDAFVAPTRYEAFGVAVLEALCCGLPAIVSREAGVAERYPAALGQLLLSDPESVSELTAKLREVVAEADRWARAVRPVADELRSYTWKDMARNIHNLMATQ